MNVRQIARSLVPPIIAAGRQRTGSTRQISDADSIRFLGDFDSWEAASAVAIGYSAPEILAKTRAALLKVKAGEVAFERDSVVFEVMQYEFPLLAGFLRVAAAVGNKLSVLDFGGALGSTYFQCRSFLAVVPDLLWSVVEQEAHVTCGRTDFANEELQFYTSIEECLGERRPNVLLLSSVLQYLPDPYEFLASALQHQFDFVMIDRTAFIKRDRDRLTVQHVPAWIYQASYPAWFLSEPRLHECFRTRYDLVYEFDGADQVRLPDDEAYFKGFQFRLRSGQEEV